MVIIKACSPAVEPFSADLKESRVTAQGQDPVWTSVVCTHISNVILKIRNTVSILSLNDVHWSLLSINIGDI